MQVIVETPHSLGSAVRSGWRIVKGAPGVYVAIALSSVVMVGLTMLLLGVITRGYPVVNAIASLGVNVWGGMLAMGVFRALARGQAGHSPSFDDLFWAMPRVSLWLLPLVIYLIFLLPPFVMLLLGGHPPFFFNPALRPPHLRHMNPAVVVGFVVWALLFATVTNFTYAMVARYEVGPGAALKAFLRIVLPGHRRWLALVPYLVLLLVGASILAAAAAGLAVAGFHLLLPHLTAPARVVTIVLAALALLSAGLLFLLATLVLQATFVAASANLWDSADRTRPV
ncbi:MAG: DUF2189 domain-containing protein [Acidiferrobacteraceae bacterium]